MRRKGPRPFMLLLVALVIWLPLVSRRETTAHAADGTASNSIAVTLEKDKNVGLGFRWLPRAAAHVLVTLKAPTNWWIVTNEDTYEVTVKSGDTIWLRHEPFDVGTHTYKGFGFNDTDPRNVVHSRTYARFDGDLYQEGEGEGKNPQFRVSVADIDIDIDCIAPHSEPHWPPDGDPDHLLREDLIEDQEPDGGLAIGPLIQGVFPDAEQVTTQAPYKDVYKLMRLSLKVPWGGNPDATPPRQDSPEDEKGYLQFHISGSGAALYYTDNRDGQVHRVVSGQRIPIVNDTDIAQTLMFLTNEQFVNEVSVSAIFAWHTPKPGKTANYWAKDYVRLVPARIEAIDGYVYGEPERMIANMESLVTPANVVAAGYVKFKATLSAFAADALYFKWSATAGVLTDPEGVGSDYLEVKWDAPDGHEQDVTLTLQVRTSASGPVLTTRSVSMKTIRPHVMRVKFVAVAGNEEQPIYDCGSPQYDCKAGENDPLCYIKGTKMRVQIDLAGAPNDDDTNDLAVNTPLKITATAIYGAARQEPHSNAFDEAVVDNATSDWSVEDYVTAMLTFQQNEYLPNKVFEYEDLEMRWTLKVKHSSGNWVTAYEEASGAGFSHKTLHKKVLADGTTCGMYLIFAEYQCDPALFRMAYLDVAVKWAEDCDKVDVSDDATNVPIKVQAGAREWFRRYGYKATGSVPDPFGWIPKHQGDCRTYAELMTVGCQILGVSAQAEYLYCKENYPTGRQHFYFTPGRTPHWLTASGDADGDDTTNGSELGYPGTIDGVYVNAQDKDAQWRRDNTPFWNYHGCCSCAGHWWDVTFDCTPGHDTEEAFAKVPDGPVFYRFGPLKPSGRL